MPQTRRAILKRGGVLLIAILVTTAFLWNVTYAGVQRSQMEDAIESDVKEILDDEQYANVTLLSVKVNQDRGGFLQPSERVIVTIGRPPNENHPGLHRNITERIHERSSEDVPVEIQVSLLITESRNE